MLNSADEEFLERLSLSRSDLFRDDFSLICSIVVSIINWQQSNQRGILNTKRHHVLAKMNIREICPLFRDGSLSVVKKSIIYDI